MSFLDILRFLLTRKEKELIDMDYNHPDYHDTCQQFWAYRNTIADYEKDN